MCLVGLLGCSADSALGLDVQEGDWVITAGVSRAKVNRAELTRYEGRPFSLEIDAGQTPVAFVIRPSIELFAMGREALADPLVVVGDAGGVGCGGCPGDAVRPPLYAFDGAVCGLPAWVRGSAPDLPADALELVRDQLSIAFSGTCQACEFSTGEPGPELSVELESGPESRPFELAATSSSGEVVFVSRTTRRKMTADGRIVDRPAPGHTPVGLASMGDRYLLLERESESLLVEALDADLSTTTRLLELTGSAKAVSLGSLGALVLGHDTRVRTRDLMILCRDSSCQYLTPLVRTGTEYSDAVLLDSGALAVAAKEDGVVILDRVPRPEEVMAVTPGEISLSDGSSIGVSTIPATGGTSALVGALRDRIFSCGPNSHDDSLVISTSRTTDPALETIITLPPPTPCLGLIPVSPDEIAASLHDELLILNLEGELVERRSIAAAFPELDTWVARHSQTPDGRTLVRSGHWDYFLRASLERPFRQISPNFDRYGLLADVRGEPWSIRGNQLRRLGGPSIETGFSRYVQSVMVDGDRILGASASGVDSFDASTGQTERLSRFDRPEARPPFRSDLAPVALAKLGENEILVAEGGAEPSLYVNRGGILEPVALPEQFRHAESAWINNLHLARSPEGVVFVSMGGVSPRLLRVLPGPTPYVELLDVQFGGPTSGLIAPCADVFVVLGHDGAVPTVVRVDRGRNSQLWRSSPEREGRAMFTLRGRAYSIAGDAFGASVQSLAGGPVSFMDGIPWSHLETGDSVLVTSLNGALWRMRER